MWYLFLFVDIGVGVEWLVVFGELVVDLVVCVVD